MAKTTARRNLVLILTLLVLWATACSGQVATDTPEIQDTGAPTESVSPTSIPSTEAAQSPSPPDTTPVEDDAPPLTEAPEAVPDPGSAAQDIDEFFETSWRMLALRDPENVLADGLAEVYGLEGAELTNISDAYRRETFTLYESVLGQLRTYDRAELTPEQQVSYDVYEWYLVDRIGQRAFMYNDYPATWFPVTSEHEWLVYFFADLHPVANSQDAKDYVARLGQVGAKFEQLLEGLELRQEAGIVQPRWSVGWTVYGVGNMARARATQTPYYEAFVDKVNALDDTSPDEKAALLAEAEKAINDTVLPAYQDLAEFLQKQESIAPADDGLWQFENGLEYYEHLLRHYTTASLTAGEIHELGQEDLTRIHAEMRLIFDDLGYPKGESLTQLFDRVEQDGGTVPASEVLATYEELIQVADANLGGVFDVRPKAEVEVVASSIKGMYVSAAMDGSRPGAFHAGPGTSAEARYAMPTLAYHEAVPGHHFQIALAQESDLPSFRNAVGFTGFAEGWALYAEQLAAEMGWYEDDPYGDLGRLQAEAFRAARLVVDTGIHAMGWTSDQATEYFSENTGYEAGDSVDPDGQIARYIVWPGQATSYKIGGIKILELRQRAMDAQGDQFDLSEFHNVVLTNGSMPLDVLEGVIDAYIESKATAVQEPAANTEGAEPTESAAMEDPPTIEAGAEDLRLTIVYDNTAYEPGLRADWGFAAYLQYGEHTILFDTGANGALLLLNMDKLGLDPMAIDAIVLSHEHGDHTQGLPRLLDLGLQVPVYAPTSFPDEIKDGIRAHTELVEIDEAVEIVPGMWSTGELGLGITEQGLAIQTSEGVVVLTGCAHPGIVKMVRTASRLVEGDITLVLGGFHLGSMADSSVTSIINQFRDLGVERAAPTHCTGEEAIAAFAQAYGDDWVEGGVGRVLTIGAGGGSLASFQGFGLRDAGFETPESILYDAQADLYLVSNINGSPSKADGNGFISRVSPQGEVVDLKWIDGAADGTSLNAPKGSALVGDRLFVADLDTVRAFDRQTGAALGETVIEGARFLNDLAAGADGTLYVTDSATGIIYVVQPEGGYGQFGAQVKNPNGIVATGDGILVTAGGSKVLAFDGQGQTLAEYDVPAGGLDGLVLLDDGAILVASWNGSAVYHIGPDDEVTEVFGDLDSPADIGFDAVREAVLIPLFDEGAIEVWPLP